MFCFALRAKLGPYSFKSLSMSYLPSVMVRIVFVLFAALSIEFRAVGLLGKCSV